ALRNAKAVLKPHGLLLLNEIACTTLFAHLTFGLQEELRLYEDAELRLPGCLGRSPQSWQKILAQDGFHSVIFPAQEAHHLGCSIIVAASDGIVRQKRAAGAVAAPPHAIVHATGVTERPTMVAPTTDPARAEDILREHTIAYLKHMVGEALKIPVHRLD